MPTSSLSISLGKSSTSDVELPSAALGCDGGLKPSNQTNPVVLQLLMLVMCAGACLDGGAGGGGGGRAIPSRQKKKKKTEPSGRLASVLVSFSARPDTSSGRGLLVCRYTDTVHLKGIGISVCCLKLNFTTNVSFRRAAASRGSGFTRIMSGTEASSVFFFVLSSKGSRQEL